ncbi:uncharacterized protein LOC122815179 isoform X2 [Protopterus annectens]|uniref:uncharacterized protein LOC122815179 isoform X2 n=1 Tax=Protopterus annectens TaxID=7888 RepID=UPI001CFBC799|nr:uncharacterized protein LOC122815179 isoform X2 [Protopterus annectens]
MAFTPKHGSFAEVHLTKGKNKVHSAADFEHIAHMSMFENYEQAWNIPVRIRRTLAASQDIASTPLQIEEEIQYSSQQEKRGGKMLPESSVHCHMSPAMKANKNGKRRMKEITSNQHAEDCPHLTDEVRNEVDSSENEDGSEHENDIFDDARKQKLKRAGASTIKAENEISANNTKKSTSEAYTKDIVGKQNVEKIVPASKRKDVAEWIQSQDPYCDFTDKNQSPTGNDPNIHSSDRSKHLQSYADKGKNMEDPPSECIPDVKQPTYSDQSNSLLKIWGLPPLQPGQKDYLNALLHLPVSSSNY